MKCVASLLLLLSLLTVASFAQEEPIPPKRSKAAKIGGLGGFIPAWLFVDVKEINNFLRAGKGAPLKESGVFLTGGSGAAYIMIVPNLRVGGLGMGGSISSSSYDGSVRRDAELRVGFGGVTFEYVMPIAERFDVAFGTMLGGGGIDLTLRQDFGTQSTWNGEQAILGGPANAPPNLTRQLNGSFFVAVPSVNFEYAITGWFGIRLGASYVAMFAPSWEVDDHYDLLGVPSSVSGKGFMLNAGLFVGTF